MRSWTIKGFDDFRIYYLNQDNEPTIVRLLHGKRDIGTILENEQVG